MTTSTRLALIYKKRFDDSILSCLAGQGKEWTTLMTKLSVIWPGRSVVAFSTLGYRHGGEMYRSGKNCTEVSVRETDDPDGWISGMPTKPFDEQWKDLEAMPRESEYSPHAKIVIDGVVAKLQRARILLALLQTLSHPLICLRKVP
jgi:hypothetical protein